MTFIEKFSLVSIVFSIILTILLIVGWFYIKGMEDSPKAISLSNILGISQVIIGVIAVFIGLFSAGLVIYGLQKIQTVLPMAVYSGLQKYRTEGQNSPLLTDVLGNIQSTLATKIAGEDLNFDVMKTQVQGSLIPPLTRSALVRSGSGRLFGYVVNSGLPGASIKILDSQNSTGTVMFDTMRFDQEIGNGPKVITFPAAVGFNIGCYFDINGTISVTPILN